jgi:transcriptional regulator with XRE-family HTH domain
MVISRTRAYSAFAERLALALDAMEQAGCPRARGRALWVANRYGVSGEAARKWLVGLAIPDQANLARIADDTCFSVNWLHAGIGSPRSSGVDVPIVESAPLAESRDSVTAGFYGRLVEALAKAGHPTTQTGISELVDVTQTAVSAWANAGSFPRMDTLIRLADLTGCSLDWLISGRGDASAATAGEPDAQELLRIYRLLRVDGRAFVMQAARTALAAQAKVSDGRTG